MANLKDLRNRIDSVKSTRKITQAMKMVAASKLRRAQEVAESARPYSEKLSNIMSSLNLSLKDSEISPAMLKGNLDNKIKLILVVTSDRGLCGAFNSSIVRKVKNQIVELESENISTKLICIGKKGAEILKNIYGEKVISTFEITGKENNLFNFAPPGNIVGTVPPGTGIMVLATSGVEIFKNEYKVWTVSKQKKRKTF